MNLPSPTGYIGIKLYNHNHWSKGILEIFNWNHVPVRTSGPSLVTVLQTVETISSYISLATSLSVSAFFDGSVAIFSALGPHLGPALNRPHYTDDETPYRAPYGSVSSLFWI
jgi:hypothetical protein